MKRWRLAAMTLTAALALRAADAAPSIDMATMSCQDWIDASDDEQDQMVAWLRGYFANKSSATLYDLSSTAARRDRDALMAACRRDLAIGVISAASKALR